MTVDPAVLIPGSQTCSEDAEGNLTYEAVYIVNSDDGRDGPQVVKTASGLPAQFSAYAIGNDSDTSAHCISRNPLRRGDSNTWDVHCTWSTTLGESTQRDQNGEPTNDPEQWVTKWATGNAPRQEEVNDARWHHNSDGSQIQLVDPNGAIQVVQNAQRLNR